MNKYYKFPITLLTVLIISCESNKLGKLSLASLFQDQMVAQQDTLINVWGWSTANAKISLKTSWGEQAGVLSDSTGSWHLKLRTPKVDHQLHKMTVKSGRDSLIIKDILMGEVWLASGQSNMEMPIKGFKSEGPVDSAGEEIPNAKFPEIRMFTVGRKIAFASEKKVSGKWKACSPETVGDFSAVGYFFSKKLHLELNVPIGIIHSSWSGSPAETWTKSDFIEKVDGHDIFGFHFNETSKKLVIANDPNSEYNKWVNGLEKVHFDSILKSKDIKWLNLDKKRITERDYIDNDWDILEFEQIKEIFKKNYFNGSGWLRNNFEIKDNAIKEFNLKLGKINTKLFTIFINGKMVYRNESWGKQNPNTINLPENILKKGKNIIAIRLIDSWGSTGDFEKIKDFGIYNQRKKIIGFSDQWKFKATSYLVNQNFHILENGINEIIKPVAMEKSYFSPSTLFNGMIAPIVPYTLKGFIWYQGESNRGKFEVYKELFPSLIDSWRQEWENKTLPFYYVQLAPVGSNENPRQDSIHAEFRDVQRKALAKSNLGMAITSDIGHPRLIHAPKKKPVGERLALWALAKDYGLNDLTYSGPLYKSISFNNSRAYLSFDHVGEGLHSNDKFLKYFEIADQDKKFYDANAVIENKKVIVWSKKISNPKFVRYGWKSYFEPNFFNKEGLPASSFSTINEF